MSRFKKKGKRGTPGISTASLPDIVFMLLFFFMVATTVREESMKVKIELPNASEVMKIEDKSKLKYIYVGKSTTPGKHGTEDRVQMNGQILADALAVQGIANQYKGEIGPDIQFSLKIDKGSKMFTVNQVKENLREVNCLNIIYASSKREN